MESEARRILQVRFDQIKIGDRFQMVNSVMKAAIPGSEIFAKVSETHADNGGGWYIIRPDWMVEIVKTNQSL